MTYLILIRGASGVGKTTIAESFAKKLPSKVAFLSYDILFFNILINHKVMPRKYKMNLMYEMTESVIKKFLKEGFSIVIEGMYTNKIKNKLVTERVFQIGKQYKVKTFVFDLLADIDTIIHRATKIRKANYDLIPEAHLDLKKSHEEFMSKLYTKAIQIETKGKSIEQVTKEMLKIVRKR